MKYAAFISYRHGGIDEKVGMQIQHDLERYKIPSKIAKSIGKKSLGKVFRDADDLRAASDLSAIIRAGIDESEYLIVICTKRYQKSVWCMEEIEYFLETRDREHIIVVLVEGEPQESFPEILTNIERDGKIVAIEPLAVDVRAETEKQILKNVTKEKLRYISQMLDMDYDDLKQRQKERQRKRNAILAGIVFAGVAVFASVVSYKNVQLNTAYDSLDHSMQQTLKGQSYYLSEYSNTAYLNGDRATAALLALKALPKNLEEPDRPFVPSVMRSLSSALGVYDFSSGYQPDKVYDFNTEAYHTKVTISKKGTYLVIERYQAAANNMLNGKAYIYRIDNRKLVQCVNLDDISKTAIHTSSHMACLTNDEKIFYYLGKDGLCAMDLKSGKELFTGQKGCQMVLSEQNDVISVYDDDTATLYSYATDGKLQAQTALSAQKKYALYCISPDSSIAVLSQDAKDGVGILLADTSNGGTLFADKSESCSQISFINDHSLCFVRQDTQMGKSHIVVYDLNENADDYLVDSERSSIGTIAVSGNETCFFYVDKDVCEVSNKTGKVIWKNTYSSDVTSVKAQGDYLMVTLKNGQSYFYNSKKHLLINQSAGNEENFYAMALNEDYACSADFWGKNIRLYSNKKKTRKDVTTKEIITNTTQRPEKWYTASSNGKTILLDFKNGMQDTVKTFRADTLEMIGSTTLKDMDYESFNNLSVSAENDKYISIQDYAYGANAHFNAKTMKKVFSYDEDSYYFYNDDRSLITIAQKNELVTYDAVTGKVKKKTAIPDAYDRGLQVGDYTIFGNDKKIAIRKKGKKDVILKDAVIYTSNEKQKLLCYRSVDAGKWYVYSLEKGKVISQGKAGTFACTIFLDDGTYFLNDYNAVYDARSGEKVLDLSDISTGVYGVYTNKKIPYFVVWYQSGEFDANGKSSGSNMAYLYNKKHPEEIVASIPNFVAMAEDGSVITFDGDRTLYKTPLYSEKELLKKGNEFVKGMKLTKEQKEKYHLFTE